MRPIDADVLKQHIDKLPALPDGNFAGNHSALKALINMQPTIEPSTNCSETPNSSDLISRQAAIDALDKRFDNIPMEQTVEILKLRKDLKELPTIQPEEAQLSQEGTTSDIISRQAAIDELVKKYIAIKRWGKSPDYNEGERKITACVIGMLFSLPPAQPEYEPVTAEDFAKTMSETSIFSYMLWYSEALTLMEKQGFVICKKTI